MDIWRHNRKSRLASQSRQSFRHVPDDSKVWSRNGGLELETSCHPTLFGMSACDWTLPPLREKPALPTNEVTQQIGQAWGHRRHV
jgi:hypothetical protein